MIMLAPAYQFYTTSMNMGLLTQQGPVTANISQCFMTKHCKKIEERDTLLFTILLNTKKQISYKIFFVFLLPRCDLRSLLVLGL